jgi:hypothetical protein
MWHKVFSYKGFISRQPLTDERTLEPRASREAPDQGEHHRHQAPQEGTCDRMQQAISLFSTKCYRLFIQSFGRKAALYSVFDRQPLRPYRRLKTLFYRGFGLQRSERNRQIATQMAFHPLLLRLVARSLL